MERTVLARRLLALRACAPHAARRLSLSGRACACGLLRCSSLAALQARVVLDAQASSSAEAFGQAVVRGLAGGLCGWETGAVLARRPATVLGLASWRDGLFEVRNFVDLGAVHLEWGPLS